MRPRSPDSELNKQLDLYREKRVTSSGVAALGARPGHGVDPRRCPHPAAPGTALAICATPQSGPAPGERGRVPGQAIRLPAATARSPGSARAAGGGSAQTNTRSPHNARAGAAPHGPSKRASPSPQTLPSPARMPPPGGVAKLTTGGMCTPSARPSAAGSDAGDDLSELGEADLMALGDEATLLDGSEVDLHNVEWVNLMEVDPRIEVSHRRQICKLRRQVGRLRPLAAEDQDAARLMLRMQASIEDLECQIAAGKKREKEKDAQVKDKFEDEPTRFERVWAAAENWV